MFNYNIEKMDRYLKNTCLNNDQKTGKSIDYELTITLLPKLYKYTSNEQFEKTKNFINSLRGYKVTCVAELTQTFNVHYHMIISSEHNTTPGENILDILRQYHNMFGKKSFSQVMDYNKWTTYLKKKPYAVLIDDYHLFTEDPSTK